MIIFVYLDTNISKFIAILEVVNESLSLLLSIVA